MLLQKMFHGTKRPVDVWVAELLLVWLFTLHLSDQMVQAGKARKLHLDLLLSMPVINNLSFDGAWHGMHQGAQKSTRTGCSDSRTVS